MSLALKVLKTCAPPVFKKRILRELYLATARAFDTPPPPGLRRLSHGELLESYASFTASQAERALQDADSTPVVEGKLYRESRALGERLRRTLRLRTTGDVLATSRILYAALGIDFEGREPGEVIIRRCYFSRFYTADICRVMSSADAGVAAGLSGGGRLEFSQRITEGGEACRARLVFGEPGR
jgi:hypothetical protein